MIVKMGRRISAAAVALVCMAALSGCDNLGPIVHDIAESQGVDEAVVRQALEAETTNQDAEVALAKQWQRELPEQRIPDLSTLDTVADYSMEKLKEAACEAIVDMLITHEVPTGQQFVQSYVEDALALPQLELQSIVDDFDALWREAAAGTLTSTDIRLTLMKYQYC